ncbi:MAG TPA: YbdK family carboxylate-amine ligase [Longimicrobiales bacterium]|nr:YbdK family carboxylate-amine ligase [Longimicrobiales bacterium]
MSGPYTVGVEEEYQVVDPESGGLRDGAQEVLAADWTDAVRAEIHRSTIEVASSVCASATEMAEELARMRTAAAAVAASVGLGIAAAGLHPFSRWQGRQRTPGRRYEEIEQRYGRLSQDEHNFGMHVHVGIPEDGDRIGILNGVRAYLPHLLALSASSPFHEGADSGFSSFRMILWRRWPVSSVPPRFDSEREYTRFLELFLRSGALADKGTIYWSARLHGRYPTLELRVTDVCPRMEDAAAIVALCRALVAALAEGTLPCEPPAGLSASVEREVIATNEWRAARWGVKAELVDAEQDGPRPLRDSLRELVERVGPTAERLGDGELLEGIEVVLRRGNGADRLRALMAEGHSLADAAHWLRAETLLGTAVDRRAWQREGPGGGPAEAAERRPSGAGRREGS